MENRYNSNKVLEYKRTPSKSRKRSLNGNCSNSGFLASSKHATRYGTKENPLNNSRDLYSDRKSKKKYDKRAMSSGVRRAKDLYLSEELKHSPKQGSSKKDRFHYNKYDNSTRKSSKSKKAHYPAGMNYMFSQPSHAGVKMIKQHNMAKKHVDHRPVNASFQYKVKNEILSAGSPKSALNQSASTVKRSSIGSHMPLDRRMNNFNAPPNKSRHQCHYRMGSSSNHTKNSENRSSSMIHQSDLTPLHSN